MSDYLPVATLFLLHAPDPHESDRRTGQRFPGQSSMYNWTFHALTDTLSNLQSLVIVPVAAFLLFFSEGIVVAEVALIALQLFFLQEFVEERLVPKAPTPF